MNIFGVGLPEITVILILGLLIFGPKKLPELGKQLGKTLKSLKNASNEFQAEIYIKPARSINFITITFVATRTGVSFNELIG